MAYLGGGFTSAVAAAGNAILSGKELQVRDDEIQLQKQQIAMGQLALANAQRQQQTQATVGAFLSSEAQKDNSAFTDPAKSAQLYEKAAGLALQGGDFVSANEMGELAKGKMQEAKEQLVVAAQQKHQKQEDLATTADDYSTNPTPEGAKDLMRKAIDAGVNPTNIPMPGTPQWGTWVNSQKQAAMDSKSRAQLAEKAQEFTQRQQQQREEHQDNINTRMQEHRDNVMLREAMIQAREPKAPTTKEMNGGIYEYDPTGQVKGTRDSGDAGWVRIGTARQGANAGNTDKAIVASSREALRGLKIIGAMSTGQTGGPFAGMGTGNYLDRVAAIGSAMITPEEAQDYDTATAGLGLETARALTLGAGKGPNQSTIDEMQHIIKSPPGTPVPVAVFKYANAMDIIRNRLESAGTMADPQQDALRVQALKEMEKVPDPVDVLKATRDPKLRKQMLSSAASMAHTTEKMQEEIQQNAGGAATGLPGSPDTGTGTTAPPIPAGSGLPSGWSVKEH